MSPLSYSVEVWKEGPGAAGSFSDKLSRAVKNVPLEESEFGRELPPDAPAEKCGGGI
jgi:hypothetical protein